MPQDNYWIWLDLEMTGLQVEHDRIIELAMVVTDYNLNTIAEFPGIAIRQDKKILDSMDEWNQQHHGQSGLIAKVENSKLNEQGVESLALQFLQKHVTVNSSPMCGNSICQDRRFLAKYMPNLAAFFHYRNLDVSTLKILAQQWHPAIMTGLCKDSQHQALADIYESIEELRYYRQHWLQC